jgi:leucyl/phenylalanyl-tRNA--protein transferase
VRASRWLLPDPAGLPDDMVGLGADLEPETLVDAYRRGIFPWPHEGMPLPWFSPDPRALIQPGRVHVSRTLRRRLRTCGWETTVDRAFADVVAGCTRPQTWITPAMRAAYARLQQLGWAHSLEVWDGDRLVGGIYGVRVGACFTGESMFHTERDASKVALVDLVARWAEAGGAFVDVQVPTDHLASMGAVAVPRAEYLARLAEARDRVVAVETGRLPVSRLALPAR